MQARSFDLAAEAYTDAVGGSISGDIERITYTNFPEAVQVMDWYHANERLCQVAHAVFGQGTAQGKAWVEGQLDLLWSGQVCCFSTQSVV